MAGAAPCWISLSAARPCPKDPKDRPDPRRAGHNDATLTPRDMKFSTPYLRLVLEITLAAALIELLIMRLVPLSLPGISGWREAVADAVLLVLALGPVAWWRSVRAFQRHARQGGHPTIAIDAAGSLGLSMIVLVTGMLLSLWAGQRVGATIENQARERFERITVRLEQSIRQRFAMPLFGLRGAHGTHNASEKLDRASFRNYVHAINIDQQFPGVRGFGYIVKVDRHELSAFERTERADHAESFSVATQGEARDLYVIKMIEPMAGNLQALGLDVGADPVRRAAVLSAIDTGQPTLTGPITLKQDERQRPGVLYLLPLYQGAVPPLNLTQRRASLVGIYYAPIVIDELMQGLFDSGDRQLNISLSDETGADPVEMFRVDGTQASEHGQRFATQRTLSIAGRQYVLRTQANATFEQRVDRATPSWIVLGGSLLSALLALATWMLASARARTEALAANLTVDLERLAEVARRTSNAVMITDPEKRIRWVNEGFTRQYGYSFEEAQGQDLRALVGAPDCPEDRLTQLDAALARGETCRVELLNRGKDGQTFWVDTEIQPRHNAQGELLGYIEIAQNISDLKEATHRLEAAQRETDALLRTLNAHAVISVSDRAGRIVEVNDAFCALSGYSRDELVGRSHRINNSGVHDRAFWTHLWDTVIDGRAWRGEICNRTKSGSLYWVDSVIAPFMDAEGRVEKFIAIRHDVTWRKLTEQQLRSNEAFLERVSRIAGVGGWLINLQSREIEWSDQACAIYGLPRGHRGSSDEGLSFIAPEWRPRLVEALKVARRTHSPADLELQATTADHRPVWLRVVAEFEFEQDQPVRLVGTSQDITERRLSQARLNETSTLLTNVLNAASGIAVIATDADLVIRVFNTGAERLLGYRASEIVGHTTPLRFHDPARITALREAVRARLGDVEPTPVQLLIEPRLLGQVRQLNYVRQDGSLVPVSIVVTEMRSEQGEVTGYLGIVQDRTQSLEYETSLQQAKLVAEQASAAKGQFLANMSHEIRTPMNAILGMLRLLHKTTLDERQRDYASKAERAAQSLLGLLNDILDFSKIEAGKMSLHPRAFSVGRLLSDLHVVLSANLGDKPVALNFTLDPQLPEYLVGDDLRLLQVLINLGGNAIKFTHQGQVDVALEVLSHDDEQVHLRVSVRDTGIGMSAQALAHIFEGFSQAEGSTTRKYGGTGLGLAISRRLVTLMGSQILVRSEPGQGSTFWFDLTLREPNVEDADPSAPMPLEALAPMRRLAGWRLLLVEDNPNNRQVASELLEGEGAEVSMAHNGAEGVQAVLNGPDLIDAVLMDVQMPVMDGLAATRALREALGEAAPPVIAMTANALPADLAACQEAGMVAHVGKPFDLTHLIETVLTHGRRGPAPVAGSTSLTPPGQTPTPTLPVHAQVEAQAQGVALDAALGRLGHRQDVYLRLLTRFCEELPGAAAQARQDWAHADAPALRAWLHSFKGLAGTLGLQALQAQASAAEQACPSELPGGPLPDWLAPLLRAMDEARTRLPTLLAALTPPSQATTGEPQPLDRTLLHTQVQELIKLLQRSDMTALDCHARLQDAHAQALGEALMPLNDAMAHLDFAGAIEHGQRLLTNWPLE